MVSNARSTRVEARLNGRTSARETATALGRRIREARKRRRRSQSWLAGKVGISAAWVSEIERGDAPGVPLEIWFALSHALDIALRVEFQRDPASEPIDAGHLKLQELALSLGRQTGRTRGFEVPTRRAEPTHSVDVFLRDDAIRVLFIVECWNTFGNVNASVRSTRHKIAEAEQLAVGVGGDDGPYRVAAVWIVRDTRVNRALIARYPEVFANTFTGSSTRWAESLMRRDVAPPADLGLIWTDINATRIFAWRKR